MIKVKTVGPKHFICQKKCSEKLDPLIHTFWDTRNLKFLEAEGAVIALDGDKIIGFIRYFVGRFKWYDAVGGLGTYVLPAYRNKKLASKMWAAIIRKVRPSFIIITLTSRNMKILIRSLEKKFPSVKFYTKKEYD